jgi:hypothetical protein
MQAYNKAIVHEVRKWLYKNVGHPSVQRTFLLDVGS